MGTLVMVVDVVVDVDVDVDVPFGAPFARGFDTPLGLVMMLVMVVGDGSICDALMLVWYTAAQSLLLLFLLFFFRPGVHPYLDRSANRHATSFLSWALWGALREEQSTVASCVSAWWLAGYEVEVFASYMYLYSVGCVCFGAQRGGARGARGEMAADK